MTVRLGLVASTLALASLALSFGAELGCGGDDPAIEPDAGGGASGGASGGPGGGTASGGTSGGASGGSSGGAADAGRIGYPPGAGTYGLAPDGGVACSEATSWTRTPVAEPEVAAAAPLALVARGAEVAGLFATASGLLYGRRDGAGAWAAEPVTVVGAGAGEGSLALAADGTPHVAYTREDDGHVGYAVRTGPGTWSATTVREGAKARVAAIAVEPDGTPQVVIDGLGGAGHLEWRRGLPDGGFGAPEVAQRSEQTVVNVGPTITLGPDGPLVCFAGTVSFSIGVGCVRRAPNGAWSEVIRSGGGGQTSGAPSVAVAADGAVELVWPAISFATVPTYTLGRSAHAPLADGGFAATVTEALEQGRGQLHATRVARDGAGNSYVAWQVIDASATTAAIKIARLTPDGKATGAVVACDARLRWELVVGPGGPEVLYRPGSAGQAATPLERARPVP